MAVYLSPLFGAGAQLFDSQGRVLAGGTINTYLAGTTTPQQTYADNLGITPNSVNISLDSAGRPSQEIWLTGGIKYKFIVLSSTAVQQGPTYDNISGVNDPGTGAVPSTDWTVGTTPTYISASQFSVTGDQRTTYSVGRRIKATITAGTTYATVSAVSFASVTTVTVVVDSTVLDSGLSAVWYGIDGTLNPSVDAVGTTYKDTVVPPSSPVSVATVAQRVDRANRLNTTGGSGTAYTLTPTPALAAYATNAPLLVKFHADASGSPTLNVSGLGTKSLMQVNSSGTKVAASVKAGQISEIVYDGTDLVCLLSAGSGCLLRTTIFKTSGTWTKSSDVGFVVAEAVGGGGGAISSVTGGGGGGGGGYSFKRINSPGATETVTVGAGGVGANDGTTSSFGSHITANGGKQGGVIDGGAGGTAAGGDLNLSGAGGDYGGAWSANNYSGAGGSTVFGGGASGAINRSAGENGAVNTGGGASAGLSSAGTGGSGVVIVYEYS